MRKPPRCSKAGFTRPPSKAPRSSTIRAARGRCCRPSPWTSCRITSELVFEETFGPIIPIVRVPDDDAEVIRISNSTPFGLSSGVCTNDLSRITRFIEGLNVGTVNIWEVPGYRIEMSPFGGIKDSGNGVKEGVMEAMKFFTNVKTWSLPWPS